MRVGVAILLLFVVARIFACDIRQIPSNSMLPTLRGSETDGDRVLLDLLTPRLSSPSRFDIVAFRDPQQRGRDLVKRVVGLPGESVWLRDGDVFIGGSRYRKNAAERRRVRIPLFLASRHGGDVAAGFDIKKNPPQIPPELAPRVRERFGGLQAVDTYVSKIVPSDGFEQDDGVYYHRSGELPAYDLQVEIPVALPEGRGGLLAVLQDGGEEFVIIIKNLGGDRTHLTVERIVQTPSKERPASGPETARAIVYDGDGPRVSAYTMHVFTLSSFDCRISIEVDGAEFVATGALPFDFDGHTPFLAQGMPSRRSRTGIAFCLVEPARPVGNSVAIYRDVVYEPRGTHGCAKEYRLSRGQYFVLGDNSPDSSDSRVFGAVSSDEWIGIPRAIVSPWSRVRWLE